jgi:hypothetical protein
MFRFSSCAFQKIYIPVFNSVAHPIAAKKSRKAVEKLNPYEVNPPNSAVL